MTAVIRERNKRNGHNGHSKTERNGHSEAWSSGGLVTLAEQLRNASSAELVEAARTVGVEKIWDAMIAPLVGNGKAAE